MGYKLDTKIIDHLSKAGYQALEKTGFSIRQDVDDSQTIPFLTGQMDRTGDVKPDGGGGFRLIYSTPYAAKQYYVPMNHNKAHHAHATDHWLDPYLSGGTKYDWVLDRYKRHFEKGVKYGNN